MNDPLFSIECREREVQYFDPLTAFDRYRARSGDRDSYLLESLAGPEEDRRVALIGFSALLSIEMRGLSVEVSGAGPFVDRLLGRCAESGFRTSGHTVRLESAKDIWGLLRRAEAAFDLAGMRGNARDAFGWFGYFGYDIVHSIEDLPRTIPDGPDHPDLRLTLFSGELTLDLESNRAYMRWWYDGEDGGARSGREALMLEVLVMDAGAGSCGELDVPPPRAIVTSIDRDSYLDKTRVALDHIAAGDIYQVQVGHEVRVESDADPFLVYRRLRVRNPSPYMYFATVGDVSLIGASPELFVRVEDRAITMRPIAGTRPRRSDEDAALLLEDEKEVAEHLMLVDLCRNDISRVATAESLDVSRLLRIEKYSHVVHIVSTVTGTMEDDCDHFDVMAASFPAGTMTGAPKIRAMQIIEELEVSRRGLYAGSVGKLSFNGSVNLALCIRSMFHSDGVYLLRASAGVVADSKPENEWAETWHKMGACYWAVTGCEVDP